MINCTLSFCLLYCKTEQNIFIVKENQTKPKLGCSPSRLFEERVYGQLQSWLSQLTVKLWNWFKVMVGMFIFTKLILPGQTWSHARKHEALQASQTRSKRSRSSLFHLFAFRAPLIKFNTSYILWLKLHGENRQDIRFAAVKAFRQTTAAKSAAGCDSLKSLRRQTRSTCTCCHGSLVFFMFSTTFLQAVYHFKKFIAPRNFFSKKMSAHQKNLRVCNNSCVYPIRKCYRSEPNGTVNKKHIMFMQIPTFSWCF